MNNQQNQNEINKKGIKVNPSRDVDYGDKEKERKLAGEGEQIDQESDEEVNPSKLDTEEVNLDRGGVEFSGRPNVNKKTNADDASRTSGNATPTKH